MKEWMQAPIWQLFVPSQAVGAGVVFFDLFNATGSTHDLHLVSCEPIVDGSTAVTGTVAVNLFLTRTTAVGTGGTAATISGTSLTACTLTSRMGTPSIPSGISARLTPSGGATAGAVLAWTSVYTEETNAGSYTPSRDLARSDAEMSPILVPEGTGVRVVQGSVASVGNIGFNVIFHIARKTN